MMDKQPPTTATSGKGSSTLVVDNSEKPAFVAAVPNDLCCCPKLLPRFYPTRAMLQDKVSGITYEWNSRAHRKMRFPAAMKYHGIAHPAKDRIHFLGWHPNNVTWHICWVGMIANSLWVINGIWATWPEVGDMSDMAVTHLLYATGVAGAFLFIVTGYLGFVEAINHTYKQVTLPAADIKVTNRTPFRRPSKHYGSMLRPGVAAVEHNDNKSGWSEILTRGYPIVQDVESQKFLTSELLDINVDNQDQWVGRGIDIRIRNHVLHARIDGAKTVNEAEVADEKKNGAASILSLKEIPEHGEKGYTWWTWHPDLSQIGIFNAIVFFAATVIFFIPAFAWLPMGNNNRSLAMVLFFGYVFQIIACIGFIYLGHASMYEVAGSLYKTKVDDIGWWVSLFNTIGGYGFMVCAVLAIPSVVHTGDFGSLTKWGADFGTFWGSCAFWISGILQCIEFGSEHPISLGKKNKPES